MLDRSMCHFISEWREVLLQHSDRLESCLPLRHFEHSCHLTRSRGHKHVSVAGLEEQCKHLIPSGKLGIKNFQTLHVTFRGTTLWVDVLFQPLHGDFQFLQIPLFTKKKSIIQNDHRALLPDGDLLDWILSAKGQKGNHTIEAWKADPHDLSIRRHLDDMSKHYKVPLAFSSASVGRRKGSWEIQSTQSFESGGEMQGSIEVVHFTWKSNTQVADANLRLFHEQHHDSDSSSSESDEEEEDTTSPASPESMSDDDSDDDSVVESTTTPSRAAEIEERTSCADSESDTKAGQMTDCLVLIPSEHDPSWYPWSGTQQIWARRGCAAHPTLPLLAVSHTARQLEVIDTLTGTQKTRQLPDLADLQDAPMASLRGMKLLNPVS